MEYFDILDEQGNPTGEIKERRAVHRDGDWHKAVHIWIINSKQEVLLQKRSPHKDSKPNMWAVSCAGHIIAGEDAETTVEKEAKEELGIVLQKTDWEFLFSGKKSFTEREGEFVNNSFFEVFLVKKNYDMEDFTIQKEELSALQWMAFREYEKIIKKKHPHYVQYTQIHPVIFKLFHEIYDMPQK